MSKPLNMPPSPVGWWHVTTEGDEEGKSTRDLGTWQGHIADIARMLANKCYYVLAFKRLEKPPEARFEGELTGGVAISLDINTGTWDCSPQERALAIDRFLKQDASNVRYKCETGHYFASVKLAYDATPVPNKDEDDNFVA